MTYRSQQHELDAALAACEEALVTKVMNTKEGCGYLAAERSHRGGIKIRSMRLFPDLDSARKHSKERERLRQAACRYYRLTNDGAPKLVTTLVRNSGDLLH